MKEFLIKNWYYIVLACAAIASFLLSVISVKKRNGKTNFLDTIKEAILENVPYWIIISESLASGEDKRNNVISLGVALAQKLLGRSLTADENNYFVAFITEQLEKVLSAPQKKLEKAEISKKPKYTIK